MVDQQGIGLDILLDVSELDQHKESLNQNMLLPKPLGLCLELLYLTFSLFDALCEINFLGWREE